MMRRAKRAALLLVAPLVVVALSACGGDDEEEFVDTSSTTRALGPADSVVSLSAVDIGFEPNELAATAGIVEIRYKNEGEAPHTFLIDGMYEVFMEVEFTGETDTYKVELGPGAYTFYCDVPAHRAAGMEGTLTVT